MMLCLVCVQYIGRVGVVTTISDKDDAVVQYLNRKILHLNKDILIKASKEERQHIQTHIHTYIHTYIHIHTHTYTHIHYAPHTYTMHHTYHTTCTHTSHILHTHTHTHTHTHMQVDVHVFVCGDLVRVKEDMVEVHKLQEGHGEWNDDMALVGVVVGVWF